MAMSSNNHRSARIFATFCAIFLFSNIGCRGHQQIEKSHFKPKSTVIESVEKPSECDLIENHHFKPKSSVIERIGKPPDCVLNEFKNANRRPDYTFYLPTKEELNVIKQSFRNLPASYKKLLSERLVGIYCINNFKSNGYTNWLVDKKGKIFYFMTYNPQTLRRNISELLSEKEQSCFVNQISENVDVRVQINCGKTQLAFPIFLLHETAHVIDGINRITWSAEEGPMQNRKIYPPDKNRSFVDVVWKSFCQPVDKYDFPQRVSITFYGFNGGPKIPIAKAPELYYGLKASPFASLYGSQTSGEDFAELLMFYHLTQKMHQPYKITVIENGQKVVEYEPMKNPLVMERFAFLEQFYKE
jgi:hypothetical protein